ncbi:HIT family protein [Rhodohalobacter sp. 8-1]|uniref:HIT family protein n=1 Tax=Rhodohalobacter sp. 8-1 TaxID=3131972 RepID=UPI0030EEDC25
MCVFSAIPKDQILFEADHFYIIEDKYPVSPGHLLIVSRIEKEDYFSLDKVERAELSEVIIKAKELIESNHNPDGYNIGMNCGEVAGQTVMHFHCHVIPRYEGDMDDPRGGVRHSVAGMGYY